MPKFFIERPIFAIVISVLIMLVGGITLHNDPYGLVMAPPAHVAPDDEDMVRLIIGQSLGNMRAGGFKPEGRLGARVLEQLCEDGKLFWADTLAGLRAGRLYSIRPGPPLGAVLGWHPDTPGSEALALAWRYDDGAGPGAILPTEPLLYLDDGILGRLTLPKALAALPAGPLAVMTSQVWPLRKGVFSGTIAPSILAPRQRWPTSLCRW